MAAIKLNLKLILLCCVASCCVLCMGNPAIHNDGVPRIPLTAPNRPVSPPDSKDTELTTKQVTSDPGVEKHSPKVVKPAPTEEQPIPKPLPECLEGPRNLEKYIPKKAEDE
ncbi:uncharacterized protein LOC124171686 [Ischnura elegans]|uniref:uncharacterized protein LOC124171686 n=1 Tax=Ischnura elegans TaxID=197161 RepID=UPI001ED89D89|nr:uncharacterized protein LOC124171686 [Ischnura elegans]